MYLPAQGVWFHPTVEQIVVYLPSRMQSLTDLVAQYRRLLENGENLAVIDAFYDEEIVQVENDEPPVTGRHRLRQLEMQNLEKVTDCRQRITTLLVDERQGLVMGEMTLAFTGKASGPRRLNQAFVQHWRDGKIVYQRFYYGGFVPGAGGYTLKKYW
jgi:ketosteroid isomerase-like protein